MTAESRQYVLVRGADGVLYSVDDRGCHQAVSEDPETVRSDSLETGVQTATTSHEAGDYEAGRMLIEANDYDAGRMLIEADDYDAGRMLIEANDYDAGRMLIEANDYDAGRMLIEADDYNAGRMLIEARH